MSSVVLFNLMVICLALFMFRSSPAALSVAVLAYVFGLRHAVDADHIAAIDNATRKLTNEGKSALSAGLYFSLGHASVVVIACLIFSFTARPLQEMFPGVKEVGATVSTFISGAFLIILAWANTRSLWQSFLRREALKQGRVPAESAESVSGHAHGFLSRLCEPLFRMVSKSYHLYFIGFLFGIGFDTATEVAIFGMSATHAAGDESLLYIMIMPLLFTAGMMLIDSMDGIMMLRLYKWAQIDPIRKVNYNIAISSLSIIVAAAIGLYEVMTVFHLDELIPQNLSILMGNIISEMGIVLIFTSVTVWTVFYIAHRFVFKMQKQKV